MTRSCFLESKSTEAEVTDVDSLPTEFVHNKQEQASLAPPQKSLEYNRASNFNNDSISLHNRKIYEENSARAATRKFSHLCSNNCFILSLLVILLIGKFYITIDT